MNEDITVRNVVSTASLGREISLETVMVVFENVSKPARFPGVVYRPEGCEPVVLMFRTGRLVCVGARSWEESVNTLVKTVAKLREAGLVDDVQPVVNVENVVASFDLHRPVDIEKLSETLENMMYEPLIFPALIYWPRNPKVSLTVFSSGKGICAGAKNLEEVHRAVNLLKKTLDLVEESVTA
ncbi:MAG: hypothetical protein QXH12_07745 [Candidatus Caldarchaeum sp.]